MALPIVTAVCAFAGRHLCVERVLKCFLDQNYEGLHILLLYNNGNSNQRLPDDLVTPKNKTIFLVNHGVESLTRGKKYENVGEIFNDALSFIPKTTDIVTHMDSDDLFLPSHIKEGVKGMERARKEGKLAYKPYYSYFWYKEGGQEQIELLHNTLEPSIFVDYEYLIRTGYKSSVVDYNQGWLDPLIKDDLILVDPKGASSLIYDWSGKTGVHKISGGSNDYKNFQAHREYSVDDGDNILTPLSDDKIKEYYNKVL